MFEEISGNPNRFMYCDMCDISESEHSIFRVPRPYAIWRGQRDNPDMHVDLCCNCLKRIYTVDLVLAFYPEIADYINEDDELAASARSVTLSYFDMQCIAIIKRYTDYSKIPRRDVFPHSGARKSRVKIAAISGRMDTTNNEQIVFEVHAGYALIKSDPPHLQESLGSTSMIKWVNTSTLGIRVKYTYNLYDKNGFKSLCEWARNEVRSWLCKWHLDTPEVPGYVDLTRI